MPTFLTMKYAFFLILLLFIGLPSFAQTDKKTIINQVINAEKNKNFCGDNGINNPEKSREMSQILATQTTGVIVELSCDFLAYQGMSAYIYYQTNSQGIVEMTQFKIEKYDPKISQIREEKTMLGIPLEINTQDNSITFLTKYRGLGDIGTFYRYKIDLATKKLILIEQRERDESDIKPTKTPELLPLPEEWPLIYSR